MSFTTLGLSDAIVRALHEKGYTTPTPIQLQAIPAVLAGHDLLAGAQTGTGKTAGFVLPILQRLANIDFSRVTTKAKIRVLVLTPTRELAAQVEENVRAYSRYLDIKSMVMFGGVSINPQIQKLNRRIDILVATPGRLLDHVGQKTIDLSGVETLVLDEADRMLDMGFIRDIRKILPLLPKQRQNLLFSATFSNEIKKLADGILYEPVYLEVSQRNSANDLITQVIHPVDRQHKPALLQKLILDGHWQQVLVFMRTKHGANRLAQYLTDAGISAMAIHGNKSQGAREKALKDFKKDKLRVLVATDIAARGIDIDSLPHVVNFELPNAAEDYVHRIGRTGRAGYSGHAVSLVCIDEHGLLANIEKLLKKRLDSVLIEGFVPDPSIQAEPIRKPASHQRRDHRQPKSTQNPKTSSTNPSHRDEPNHPHRKATQKTTTATNKTRHQPQKNNTNKQIDTSKTRTGSPVTINSPKTSTQPQPTTNASKKHPNNRSERGANANQAGKKPPKSKSVYS